MKKLILTIAIIAVLSLTFVFAVSASEYDFISTGSTDISPGDSSYHVSIVSLNKSDSESQIYLLCLFDSASNIYIRPADFKNLVDFIGLSNYSQFIDFCSNPSDSYIIDSDTNQFFYNWFVKYNGLDEAYFNKLYNYIEITQADLDELQATIDSKSDEITELENANLKLEENLAYTRNQVTTLSQSRGELLAVNASLEKQLQNKINLAYAQGLVDSGSTSDVVPVLIGVITLLEGVALVILIVSKIKKRKKVR